MSRIPIPFLILLVTFMTVGSQLILKKAVGSIGLALKDSGFVSFLFAAATTPMVYVALAIQAAGYVVWLLVLAGERLSVAIAISGAFFYISTAAASWYFFDERLSMVQWLGLLLITGGVLMVTLTPDAGGA